MMTSTTRFYFIFVSMVVTNSLQSKQNNKIQTKNNKVILKSDMGNFEDNVMTSGFNFISQFSFI